MSEQLLLVKVSTFKAVSALVVFWRFSTNILLICSICLGRQWLYQTCTEFGYYQSTDSEQQVFGTLFPLR